MRDAGAITRAQGSHERRVGGLQPGIAITRAQGSHREAQGMGERCGRVVRAQGAKRADPARVGAPSTRAPDGRLAVFHGPRKLGEYESDGSPVTDAAAQHEPHARSVTAR